MIFCWPRELSKWDDFLNISPEHGWLEDDISFEHGPFSGGHVIFLG